MPPLTQRCMQPTLRLPEKKQEKAFALRLCEDFFFFFLLPNLPGL
jgi:hypothetical protein